VCGGYQMLGTSISDPDGIEGEPSSVPGLGYLDVETRMLDEKALYEVDGESWDGGVPFKGYEMHVGESVGAGTDRPLLNIAGGRPDGAVSADGRISGCYVHGLFAHDRMRAHWLNRIGIERSSFDYEASVDATLDALARHLEQHVDCDAILSMARVPDLKG
jgi:adenosylcobyric acid synthase